MRWPGISRGVHDPDYAAFGLFPPSEQVFLDVGANAGMSALSYRIFQRRGPILSVEPNPFHAGDLDFTRRVVRRMDYRLWAAGDTDGTIDLFVPIYRGVPLTTEAAVDRSAVEASSSLRARLGPRMDGEDFRIEQRTVEVHRLDELALDPAFVKLDVQGHDYPALQGLSETIARSRPVLMIESATSDSHEFLVGQGYEARTFDQESKTLGAAQWPSDNVFYLPT
jgi:FkbM family methyltransferase